MEKLTCYAISSQALQLLSPATQGNLPPTWFNWQGAKPAGRAANVSRITQIPTAWDRTEIVQWERDARSLGYDTCLILTLDDPLTAIQFFSFLDVQHSVSPEMQFLTLGAHSAAKESNLDVLSDLRQPDVFLMMSFTQSRRGGGVNLSDTAYTHILARDWWMLACEFKRWASLMYPAQAKTPHPDHPAMYDLNKWNVYSRRPDNAGIFKVPDTQLTLADFFDTDCGSELAAVANGIGSLDKPWSADTVGSDIADWSLEALASYKLGPNGALPKIEKIYPLRQAPFCGVAVTNTREVIPYGGFASLIPEHQWAWDTGEVFFAIRQLNPQLSGEKRGKQLIKKAERWLQAIPLYLKDFALPTKQRLAANTLNANAVSSRSFDLKGYYDSLLDNANDIETGSAAYPFQPTRLSQVVITIEVKGNKVTCAIRGLASANLASVTFEMFVNPDTLLAVTLTASKPVAVVTLSIGNLDQLQLIQLKVSE